MNDHKLVPVEPNLDMDKAGEKALREHCSNYRSKHAWIGGHLAAYKAMLEAAPTNPPEISSTSELNALAERVGDGELARLERAFAKRVADELEYQCLHLDGGWLDTTRYRGTFEPVAELQFLESFGLLERHPEHPELVRVKEL